MSITIRLQLHRAIPTMPAWMTFSCNRSTMGTVIIKMNLSTIL